jgi:four helix bundle protein
VFGDNLRARTRQFALDVVSFCVRLPSDDLCRVVRPQLLRAATGVAANYRAACRSRSRKEFAARLSVVIEESDESELWLDVLQVNQRGASEEIQRLMAEASELTAIMAASRSTTLSGLAIRTTRR